jgi:hypothetical protein
MIPDKLVIHEAIRLVNEGISVTLPVNGRSMLPFIIGGKDSVILQKPATLHKGDVVLAWVNNHHYVIHRIIGISGNNITLMGDGNLALTEHCTTGDVKATVTHVVDAKGHTHYIYNRWHRIAAWLWYYLRPVRRYLLKLKNVRIRKCKNVTIIIQ